ncbi:MAG: hypothetical protein ACRC1H_04165, partial [Caldilineaceae bacterium]
GPELTGDLLKRYDSITKSPAKLAEAKVDHEDMQSVLASMGLDPLTKNQSQKVLIGDVKSRMERAVDVAQQKSGKVLTREEKNAVMREEAARRVSIGNTWLGLGDPEMVPAAALSAEQLAKVEIPRDRIEKVRAQLAAARARNPDEPLYEDTPDNLRRAYLALPKDKGGLGSITAPYLPVPR